MWSYPLLRPKLKGHPNNSDFIHYYENFATKLYKKCWKGAPFWKDNLSWNIRVKGTLRVPPQPGCPRVCPPWAHRSYATEIHHFFFSHTWGGALASKYLPEGCPYMLMYSALHIMQCFSHILDVFTPKIRRKISILTVLWIKTNVAYTRLEVIAKQRGVLQVEFITGVNWFVTLYYIIASSIELIIQTWPSAI